MSSTFSRSPWIFTGPVIAILIGHYIVDIYSSVIPPLIGVVQTEFNMSPAKAAFLLGLGSICSGLAQPLFAWISHQTNSRSFGAIGILLAAAGIGLIGFSSDWQMVYLIYAIGMVGIGMFHPIASARIGAIAGDQRSLALSLFFVFGMGGFFTGSLLGPYLTTEIGTLRSLAYLILPGLLIAVAFQLSINRSSHFAKPKPSARRFAFSDYDWRSIFLLYVSAVFRFLVNMAFIYLIVRWVEQWVALAEPSLTQVDPSLKEKAISKAAAPIAGRAHAFMFVGQGIGGLAAGTLIKLGNEKLPLVLTPILFAPFIVGLAFLEPGLLAYGACFFGGIGFAAMTPITISLGQRLMPGHTRLASGIMLGGAWAIASFGPWISQFMIDKFDLQTSIIVIGCTLLLAGAAAIGIKPVPPKAIISD